MNAKLFTKILGGAVAGFGYWAWVTFLFAGTGFALPLCIAIMISGVAMIAFAEQIVGWLNKKNNLFIQIQPTLRLYHATEAQSMRISLQRYGLAEGLVDVL